MPFTASFPTRHTDTYADSGFVHAGVLLAFTELAYAGFERDCDLIKPPGVLAVPRETAVTFHRPLPWQDGCTVEVHTIDAGPHGFTQEFALRSARTQVPIATVRHDWVWLHLSSGRPQPIPPEAQDKYRAG